MPGQSPVVPHARAAAEDGLTDYQVMRIVVLVKHEAEEPVSAARQLQLVARSALKGLAVNPHGGIVGGVDHSGFHGDAEQGQRGTRHRRSEEHTSELQSLMRISYAVC